MTKDQFITTVETKTNFIKWASVPVLIEKVGDIEKWMGIAYIRTPDGTNTYQVWFMVDVATGEATWQNQDQMSPEKNISEVKMSALENYLKTTFPAYFILRADLKNNWAEADVYAVSGTDLALSKVLVYKQGANPITHKKVI